MKRPRGVSLIELTITLAIMAMLVITALPSYVNLVQNQERVKLINQMMGALHYARSKAVNEQRIVTVCSGINQCNSKRTWKTQLLVFADPEAKGQLLSEHTAGLKSEIHQDYAWYWKSFRRQPHLQYNADGTTRALNGTLLLCHGERPVHSIVISFSGRARSEPPSGSALCT